MSSGSTKRGKPSVPVRLELKQLKLGSKPQAGSEKHEQNFNSQEAALGAVNLLDASYERSSARGGTRMVSCGTKERITAVEQLSAGLAIVARLRSATSFTGARYPHPNRSQSSKNHPKLR